MHAIFYYYSLSIIINFILYGIAYTLWHHCIYIIIAISTAQGKRKRGKSKKRGSKRGQGEACKNEHPINDMHAYWAKSKVVYYSIKLIHRYKAHLK